ncbi:hypothetical protein DFH08DRAFT_814347 [Mycena albidolilacea]|uniref:Uncharacterized protein n=1 Tax=Mycena albidolilacea TaxID=1033008 RepID=A0AAD6ZPQ4_9AGAR|nr:hypothetical protein DFH08DRAFT_814347 [Mycena albidolilacea]
MHWSRASSPMPPQDFKNSCHFNIAAQSLAAAGVCSGNIHELLTGITEDVGSTNLLPITLDASLHHTAPLVVQFVAAVLQGVPDDDLAPAPTYLAAWLPAKLLPDAQLAALVPLLIALNSQNPSNTNTSDAHMEQTQHIGAALSNLLAHPPISWGPAVLLEPLLLLEHAAFPVFASPDVAVGGLARTADDTRTAAHGARRRGRGHLNPNPGGGVPRTMLAQTLMRLMLALSVLDPGKAWLVAAGGRQNGGKGEREGDVAEADGIGGRWIDIVLIAQI